MGENETCELILIPVITSGRVMGENETCELIDSCNACDDDDDDYYGKQIVSFL